MAVRKNELWNHKLLKISHLNLAHDMTETQEQSVYKKTWFYASGIQASTTLHVAAQAQPLVILQCFSTFQI